MITIKKYKYILNAAVLALTVLLGSSCKKDLLTPTPTTSIIDSKTFDTPARILSQVNGLYAGVKNGQFYGGRYVIYNEIRGEEFIINKPNGVTGLDTWSQNVNSNTNEVVNLWSAAYAAINRVNVFLAGLNANLSKVDATTANQYIGEAEFLRALSYFALVQTYAKPYVFDNGASPGLPLRLLAETDLTGAGKNDLARSTVAQVYTQILKDLDDAESKLSATQANGAFRAFKNTAIALKARVYLAQANYAKVLTETTKLISATAPYQAPTGGTKLEASIATVFTGSYTGAEALLFLPFTTSDAPGTQNQLAYYFTLNPGNGEYYLNTSGIYANAALSGTSSTDARKGFITKVSVTDANKVTTIYNYLSKYKTSSPFTDYIPVLRYSEVLLNAAEAYARTGDLVNATALLYAVRHRSDATFTFDPADIGSQTSLINTILTERRIELIGEGFRLTDLFRTSQALPAKSGAQGNSPAVAVTASNYIWPISGVELQTNKLMQPNP
ncbi:SusD family protein [Mucilaginibacter sp. OK268]|uniref:RagB/SusD family nutrient uptake outer membrane protein n=1 Tax=Mucilaginibacter sp. OK268 TaxID=1881048 RepID=UPI00088283E3|nr:RagB/SusD family nutrient uptake outer membrane protein [Mucilaginibacter sp. OK268]SDP96775.1 SusD family protein [Mucilaginibacter sp. OK268]